MKSIDATEMAGKKAFKTIKQQTSAFCFVNIWLVSLYKYIPVTSQIKLNLDNISKLLSKLVPCGISQCCQVARLVDVLKLMDPLYSLFLHWPYKGPLSDQKVLLFISSCVFSLLPFLHLSSLSWTSKPFPFRSFTTNKARKTQSARNMTTCNFFTINNKTRSLLKNNDKTLLCNVGQYNNWYCERFKAQHNWHNKTLRISFCSSFWYEYIVCTCTVSITRMLRTCVVVIFDNTVHLELKTASFFLYLYLQFSLRQWRWQFKIRKTRPQTHMLTSLLDLSKHQ